MPPAAQRRARARVEPDPSTRDRILEVALETFSLRGFDGASTRAIAAGAGVNQGLIPYYFGTKEVLWREAVDRAFSLLREELADISELGAGHDGRARLALMIRRYVAFVAEHTEFVRLMNEEGKRNGPRMRWLVDRHVRPLFTGLERAFRDAGIAERLPEGVDPIHLNYVYIGAVATIFHQANECRRLTGYDPTAPEAVVAHADTLVGLLLGDPALARELAARS